MWKSFDSKKCLTLLVAEYRDWLIYFSAAVHLVTRAEWWLVDISWYLRDDDTCPGHMPPPTVFSFSRVREICVLCDLLTTQVQGQCPVAPRQAVMTALYRLDCWTQLRGCCWHRDYQSWLTLSLQLLSDWSRVRIHHCPSNHGHQHSCVAVNQLS